ncbi:Na+/H+ antiporter NhaA [Neisseria sp. Ec49-e6-T10]|uniref:Na+/H+ antiporter NhaA n=1 Tax=Neisseria sp. Ec49-e6-T10 TaxID=3140744 RepID=UPI003EBFC5C6
MKNKENVKQSIDEHDHILGGVDAPIVLVEYGSYASFLNLETQTHIANIQNNMGKNLCYVFRHNPEPNNQLAYRAAQIIEQISPDLFWTVHVELMAYSNHLTEEDLEATAIKYGVNNQDQTIEALKAKLKVDTDIQHAHLDGVKMTPAFFINGRQYLGLWDERAFKDAVQGSLGHRVHLAAYDFAGWGPSTGLILLSVTILSIILANSSLGPAFEQFWQLNFGLNLGLFVFNLTLHEWVNDGLLTLFFLIVGLEIKHELTNGRLANRLSATLPIAGAIGGMIMPVILYLLIVPSGIWMHGWGIPIATDTAFVIALIMVMGKAVPVELRIFLTVAAIVDDIMAILIIAVFYSDNHNVLFMSNALLVTGILFLLNRFRIYRLLPYVILGIILWFCIYQSGLHATLTGIILALLIPIQKAPNLKMLMDQASSIMSNKTLRDNQIRLYKKNKPTQKIITSTLNQLEASALSSLLGNILKRLEAPADYLLRKVTPWSNYVVLPLFAFANAGVVISFGVINEHILLIMAIIFGLVIGKPFGIVLSAFLAVHFKLADKPKEYTWLQLMGASSLAGIGFTMSLFIASQALLVESDLAAAKIAIFSASVLSALLGSSVLWALRSK